MVAAPPQSAFVQAVLDELKLTPTDLGRELGWDYNRVHDWQTSRTRLRYMETMRMLVMCGWLTEEAAQALRKTVLAEAARGVDQAVEAAPKPRRQTPGSRARRASK